MNFDKNKPSFTNLEEYFEYHRVRQCRLDCLKKEIHNEISKLKKPELNATQEKGLNIEYGPFLDMDLSGRIFTWLELNAQYYTGELSKVKVYGKWHDIPRQQVAYGDAGLFYKFSGNSIPALPWDPVLKDLRDRLCQLLDIELNFVLVNRYKNGLQCIGEHKDDERCLKEFSPIVSISLGAVRDFVLKHEDRKRKIEGSPANVTLKLTDGSLLLMNYPTNRYWYHSLPKRKNCYKTRINLTFRNMINN